MVIKNGKLLQVIPNGVEDEIFFRSNISGFF